MFKSFGELAAQVPEDWWDVWVGISELGIGKGKFCEIEIPLGIERISLHQNADGRRIILLHVDRKSVEVNDGNPVSAIAPRKAAETREPESGVLP